MINATLSFHMDSKHSERHDLRQIYVSYADPSRSESNIYYEHNMTREQAYHLLFDDAVREYNSRQTRNDRKIGNYLSNLLAAEQKQDDFVAQKKREGATVKELAKYKKCTRPSYQFIVTIGNMHDNPEFKADGEKSDTVTKILSDYMNSFQARNQNAFMYNAAIHKDEAGVIHLHASVIFYADGFASGMYRRVSQNRALAAMEFVSDKEKSKDGNYQLAIEKWQNREREVLRVMCLEKDITIVHGNASRQHLTREQYVIEQ